MPQFAAPLLGAGVSALGGLFNKNKASQDTKSTSESKMSQTQEQSSNQSRTFDENPAVTEARNQMIAAMLSQFNQAQNPMIGQPQIASGLENINANTNAALNRLKQASAGAGGLFSGRLLGGNANILQGGAAQASNFMNQIPILNTQNRQDQSNKLLGLAAQWLGAGPLNENISGQSTANVTGSNTTNQTGNTTGTTGQGGWLGALGGLTSFGGGLLGDIIGGKGKQWGIGWNPGGGGNSAGMGNV